MTYKRLIVDNIDVSKCEFLIISNDKHLCRCIKSDLFGGIEFVENAKNGNCKDNPNCYFKQLQREKQNSQEARDTSIKEFNRAEELNTLLKHKVQECERLKHDNDYEVGALEKTIDNLTVENEELERLYKELQDDMLACNKCRATIKLQQQLDQLETENEKLKEQINCKCFDPKNNNNRCISYNRITEDYERDLKQLNQLKEDHEEFKNAYTRLNSLYNDNCNFTDKLEQSLTEIREIVKPHQRNIDKICGHCRRYDCCHACCIDDINCYQYKKPTTPACDKYCELKEFEINNMANQVIQKISEVEDA